MSIKSIRQCVEALLFFDKCIPSTIICRNDAEFRSAVPGRRILALKLGATWFCYDVSSGEKLSLAKQDIARRFHLTAEQEKQLKKENEDYQPVADISWEEFKDDGDEGDEVKVDKKQLMMEDFSSAFDPGAYLEDDIVKLFPKWSDALSRDFGNTKDPITLTEFADDDVKIRVRLVDDTGRAVLKCYLVSSLYHSLLTRNIEPTSNTYKFRQVDLDRITDIYRHISGEAATRLQEERKYSTAHDDEDDHLTRQLVDQLQEQNDADFAQQLQAQEMIY